MSPPLLGRRLAFSTAIPTTTVKIGHSLTSLVHPHRQFRAACPKHFARMSIEQEVSQKLKDAMKAKDADALKALRGIRAAFLTASKEAGSGDSISDETAVAQLRKLAKMRKESISMFQQGGRTDLAEAEEKELRVIEQWLPKLADNDTMEKWAKEAIDKVGATGKGDMGKVMGVVMKQHREQVDGAVLKQIVSGLLS